VVHPVCTGRLIKMNGIKRVCLEVEGSNGSTTEQCNTVYLVSLLFVVGIMCVTFIRIILQHTIFGVHFRINNKKFV
jgi:hypothetical protein